MSKTGQWRHSLQERPEYQDGWNARERGEPRHCFILTGEAQTAWLLGWDDAHLEIQPRPGEE